MYCTWMQFSFVIFFLLLLLRLLINARLIFYVMQYNQFVVAMSEHFRKINDLKWNLHRFYTHKLNSFIDSSLVFAAVHYSTNDEF